MSEPLFRQARTDYRENEIIRATMPLANLRAAAAGVRSNN
jgi:hypothetical protein